jgi:hypothetical protein
VKKLNRPESGWDHAAFANGGRAVTTGSNRWLNSDPSARSDRPDLRDPLLNYFIQECSRRCGANSYLCHYFGS